MEPEWARDSSPGPGIFIYLKSSHGLKEGQNERVWVAQSSHLSLDPKDDGTFWGIGRCMEGSLPFGVPRLVLSILGAEDRSWSGKPPEGLVPGAPPSAWSGHVLTH